MLILVVSEEEAERQRLARSWASEPDLEVDGVASGPAALDRLAARPYDAVVTELRMQPMDGIELVRRIRSRHRTLPLVITAADASVDFAVASMRAGATDFLPRSASPGVLLGLLRRAAAEAPPGNGREAMYSQVSARDFIAGEHAGLEAIRSFAERVAGVPEATVLITGESGTGKSCLARAIHALAGSEKRFVEVGCATLPPTLIESELFGHERGAFTDARALKRGLVELAAGGTLFLDEIGALSLDLQTKLLVFLESRRVRRVGGTNSSRISVRVIAAANEDLHAAVRAGRFRSDLLYRLDVASVHMPPLRDMPAVIPQLAARFAADLAAQMHRDDVVLAPEALATLQHHPWHGNVRELRNAVERALIFHEGGPLQVLPRQAREPVPAEGVHLPHGLTLEEVERSYVQAALEVFQGDLGALAAQLGISRKTLWDKRRRWALGGTNASPVAVANVAAVPRRPV